MPRLLLILLLAAAGCAAGPTREAETLSGVTQLTSGFASAENASFSPDLRYLIFTAQPWGSRDRQVYIAAVKFDGGRIVSLGAPTRVTPGGGTGGAFSPDGATVILACNGGLYRADGWRANLDAGPGAPGAVVDLARNRLPTPEGAASNPAVSPDGRHLAFNVMGASTAEGESQLWTMRIDGTHQVQLLPTGGTTRWAAAVPLQAPAFSPDGTRIAYCLTGVDTGMLYVADLTFDANGDPVAMKNAREIVNELLPLTRSAFTPDGRSLIFYSAGYEQYLPERRSFLEWKPKIDVIRTDGTGRHAITVGEQSDTDPSFSPDGRHLLWTSTRAADGTPQVFAADFKLPRGS